jgi:hypothetical protein
VIDGATHWRVNFAACGSAARQERRAMTTTPGFDAQERRAVEAAMIYRYGQLVELKEAEVELKLVPGRDDLTTVPGVYWNERDVQFVVCKLGDCKYRSYFFYTDDEQYRIGEQDYDVIEDCVRNLLQLQMDHETVRKGRFPKSYGKADEDGEEYLGPIII